MRQIIGMAVAAVFSFGILHAGTFTLEEAINYLEENGYEYEIAYDEAVKELPEGAVVFTPFFFEQQREDLLEESAEALSSGYLVLDSGDILTSYAYGDVEYYPTYKRFMLVGGYVPASAVDGYKFKWERNTTANQQSPGWTNITRSDVCQITNQRFGQQNGGNLANCSCTSANPGYECYTSSFGKILLNYYSGSTVCKRCLGQQSPTVVSVQFSVNPLLRVWVKIGGVWVPVDLYLGWVGVLTDGDTPPFDPEWNLCTTDLYYFCIDQEIRNYCGL